MLADCSSGKISTADPVCRRVGVGAEVREGEHRYPRSDVEAAREVGGEDRDLGQILGVLLGMEKPVHVLQRGVEVMDIVNLAAISVVDALERESAGTS